MEWSDHSKLHVGMCTGTWAQLIVINSEYECLLRQGSPDDAVDLFVDIQFGQTAALGVVGHTDGHRLGALGDRHCDLKELQKEQKKEELVRDKMKKS